MVFTVSCKQIYRCSMWGHAMNYECIFILTGYKRCGTRIFYKKPRIWTSTQSFLKLSEFSIRSFLKALWPQGRTSWGVKGVRHPPIILDILSQNFEIRSREPRDRIQDTFKSSVIKQPSGKSNLHFSGRIWSKRLHISRIACQNTPIDSRVTVSFISQNHVLVENRFQLRQKVSQRWCHNYFKWKRVDCLKWKDIQAGCSMVLGFERVYQQWSIGLLSLQGEKISQIAILGPTLYWRWPF